MYIAVMLSASSKAPILFIELGSVILVKPQLSKTLSPISVTDSGIVRFVRLLQSQYVDIIDYKLFVANTIEKWSVCYLKT